MARSLALVVVGAVAAGGLIAAACRGQAQRVVEAPQTVIAWKSIGSWSGRGNRQTESFRSDTGALRVRWTASVTDRDPKASGNLHVTAHSAISGRLLEHVVEHRGDGNGVGYVNQDPHVFYLLVESDHLDWTLSVEEGVSGTVAAPR